MRIKTTKILKKPDVGLLIVVKMRELCFHHSLVEGKNLGEEEVDRNGVDVVKARMTMNQRVHHLATLRRGPITNTSIRTMTH